LKHWPEPPEALLPHYFFMLTTRAEVWVQFLGDQSAQLIKAIVAVHWLAALRLQCDLCVDR
jgi:hypothetical protein